MDISVSVQSNEATQAIDRLVFRSKHPIVVALTGGWGEGKTYFWREVIVPKYPHQKPRYVSVFGAESLAIIRERIALASCGLADLVTGGETPGWAQKLLAPAAGTLRRAANFWGGKIGVTDSIAVELLQNFGLTPGSVICIDDVERLSTSVGIDAFLGYVAELRDKWKLKVVLIYNSEPFDGKPDSPFHVYQEKVIDRTIPFALDLEDSVRLAFGDIDITDFEVVALAQARAELLGLRNIRLLMKARRYFDEVLQIIGTNPDKDFLTAMLADVLLFTYTKFSSQRPEGLTFELIGGHSEWTDRARRSARSGKEDTNAAPSSAKTLLERYGYMATMEIDQFLMDFVHDDVLDAGKLSALYEAYKQEAETRALSVAFRDIWKKLYHGTLRDNAQELCDQLEATLLAYLPHIAPSELDFALRTLKHLGRAEAAEKYFTQFKEVRGAKFEALDAESQPSGTYEYIPLRKYLSSLARKTRDDRRTLGEVVAAVMKETSVSERDAVRLAKAPVNELVDYLITHDQPKLTSLLKWLAESRYEPLMRKAGAVIRKIAAMNPLNHMRLKEMGLLAPTQPRLGRHRGGPRRPHERSVKRG